MKILKPEHIVAIRDRREQLPLDLSPLKMVSGTLATGDYSYRGGEAHTAIERKSLPDFLGCVGRERERFEKEIQRLLAYETRAIVVEATWNELEAGLWLSGTNYKWRSKITPGQAVGSALGWIARGVPIIMATNHERCSTFVARLLFTAARRRWEELRHFRESV
jgi:DNA excision repair protein ERCC-4